MTPELFFQKFDEFADAPGAVARMRELVLELAVQGKLIPQDVSDEPANIALDRVLPHSPNGKRGATTAKWVEKEAELQATLPSGWAWTCNAVLGETNPRVQAPDAELVGFAPMHLIPTDYRAKLVPETRAWGEIKSGYTHFANGDVIVAKITPCFQNGKACVVDGLPGGIGAGTTELHVVRPNPGLVDPLYLLLFFRSPGFVRGGVETFTGTAGQQRVAVDYFRYCPIPLPPLAEQKRIVAKVDELMALCDRLEAQQREREERQVVLARASLARFTDAPTPENLRFLFHGSYEVAPAELRKTILTLAVRGKLVPQEPHDEPEFNRSSVAEAIKKLALHSSVDEFKNENCPFQVPKRWRWVTISEVAEARLGKMLDKEKNRGDEYPYLRNTNVHWFRFELEDVKTMRFERSELDEFRVQPGDVLICEGGHGIARTAVWNGQIAEIMFQKALHRVRPRACLEGHFLSYCIRVYEQIGVLQRYYTGAGIPHFTGKALARVVFPLPPLAEQKRIVAKVDELMALVDRLEAQLTESRATATRLLDALVAELTAAERGVEPAAGREPARV